MQLRNDDGQLGYELFMNVKTGFHKSVVCLVTWVIFSIIVSPIFKISEMYPSFKNVVLISFILVWFSGSGFIFYKMISIFRKSIICPRCNQPYIVGSFGNVPFAKKCQHCGLQMVSTKP